MDLQKWFFIGILLCVSLYGTLYTSYIHSTDNKPSTETNRSEPFVENIVQEEYVDLFIKNITSCQKKGNGTHICACFASPHSYDTDSRAHLGKIATDTCSAKTRVFYLKTFKTGSTTLVNILSRFALHHKLKVMIFTEWWSHKYDHPTLWANPRLHMEEHEHGKPHRAGTVPFDFLMEHMLYHREFIQSYFPKETTFYFTTIRDPFTRFNSHLKYFSTTNVQTDHKFRVSRNKRLSLAAQFLKKLKDDHKDFPKFADREIFTLYTARNQQLKQMKMPHSIQENATKVKQFIDQLGFDLILLTEYYDEGLVLLKRYLCWKLEDILYLKLRTRQKADPILTPEEQNEIQQLRAMYKEWSKADYILYERANETFWKLYNRQKGIQTEVEHFKSVNKRLEEYCRTNFSQHARLSSKKIFQKIPLNKKILSSNQSLLIAATEWNDEISIPLSECILYRMSDNVLRDMFRYLQIPKVHCRQSPQRALCQPCTSCCQAPLFNLPVKN